VLFSIIKLLYHKQGKVVFSLIGTTFYTGYKQLLIKILFGFAEGISIRAESKKRTPARDIWI
jgi:hypothetical protein